MTTDIAVAAEVGTRIVSLETPEFAALPPSKAEQIRAVFVPMADMLEGFEGDYNEVMALAAVEVTPEVSARARRLRLDIAKIRVAAEKARVATKAEYLLASKAIDGTNNVLKWAISEKEEALEKIEKHAELLERARLDALQAERVEALLPYLEDAAERDLAGMDDDVWAAYLATKRKDHEDRTAAAAAAEAERAERERVAELNTERQRVAAPFHDFFEYPAEDIGSIPEEDFLALLQAAVDAKSAHEAEQEEVRAEAARLAEEAEKREAERLAELARIEEERKAERARIAELEAAERERDEREKAEAEARAAAGKKAAKAPTRKRLSTWIQSFALPELPGDDHEKAAEIRRKFEAFRAWAQKEVDAI